MASSTKSTKSTGAKKSAAKKSGTAAKKSTGTKRAAPAPAPAPSTRIASSGTPRRFEEHSAAAKSATALMQHGGRNVNRAPVATSNVADVLTALASRKPEDVLGVKTPQLVKLARGESVPEKVATAAKSAARTFSSDSFGAHTTKNKLRGAKLFAILAVIAQPSLVKTAAPVKTAAKSSTKKSTTKRAASTKRSGTKSTTKRGRS